MEPTPELIDAIYRDRVLRARNASHGDKLLDGPRLFDWACSIMKAGIRMQYPQADPVQVRELLLKRLEIGRRLEEWP